MCLFFDTFTLDKVCIICYEMSDLRPMYPRVVVLVMFFSLRSIFLKRIDRFYGINISGYFRICVILFHSFPHKGSKNCTVTDQLWNFNRSALLYLLVPPKANEIVFAKITMYL